MKWHVRRRFQKVDIGRRARSAGKEARGGPGATRAGAGSQRQAHSPRQACLLGAPAAVKADTSVVSTALRLSAACAPRVLHEGQATQTRLRHIASTGLQTPFLQVLTNHESHGHGWARRTKTVRWLTLLQNQEQQQRPRQDHVPKP